MYVYLQKKRKQRNVLTLFLTYFKENFHFERPKISDSFGFAIFSNRTHFFFHENEEFKMKKKND